MGQSSTAMPALAGRGQQYLRAAGWGAAAGVVLICIPAFVLRRFSGEMAFLELAAYVAAVAAPFVCIVAYRLRPATTTSRLLVPAVIAVSAAFVAAVAIWVNELHMDGIGLKDLGILFGSLAAELIVLSVPLSFVITWYPRRRRPPGQAVRADAPTSGERG